MRGRMNLDPRVVLRRLGRRVVVRAGQPAGSDDLIVVRDGPRQGLLWWRSAPYTVYQTRPDGSRDEVFSGRFRTRFAALRAARTHFGARPPG